MRRWRTVDGRFLVEGDLPSGVQFYRLSAEHEVERDYKEEKRMLGGELHRIGFTLLGGQLMCRHIIERSQGTDDQSRVELDKLMPLTPAEEPTEKTVREAIARYDIGADRVLAAKKAKVDKLTEAAPEKLRPTFRRLAERVVFDDDRLSRQMISIFAGLAALRKDVDSSGEFAEIAGLVELAAQVMTLDPSARSASLPVLPESKRIELVDSIDRLRAELLLAGDEGDNFAAAGAPSAAVAYERAAVVLRVVALRLLAGLDPDAV